MKSEAEIRQEQERLFALIMNAKTKKPLRDEAYIQFHILDWVLEDEESIVQKRLREINAARNTTPETK